MTFEMPCNDVAPEMCTSFNTFKDVLKCQIVQLHTHVHASYTCACILHIKPGLEFVPCDPVVFMNFTVQSKYVGTGHADMSK